MIRLTASGVEIDVQVIPRAGHSRFAGVRDGRLLIRLSAPPVDGAANDALRTLFSEQLNCPRRAVRIASGEHARTKRIAIDGVARADAERLIAAALAAAGRESAERSSTASRRPRRQKSART